MNDILSFKRILLVLRADWIEYKKSLCIALGVMALILIALYWIGDTPSGQGFYYGCTLATLVYFWQIVGRKSHRPKGLFLTLPASNVEKYLSLLIEGFVILLVFQLLFWANHLLYGQVYPSYPLLNPGNIGLFSNLALLALASFASSLYFLGYMTFRKQPFLITSAGIIISVLVFVRIYVFFIESNGIVEMLSKDYKKLYGNDMFMPMPHLFEATMFIATLVTLYVAYLKLKEREIK